MFVNKEKIKYVTHTYLTLCMALKYVTYITNMLYAILEVRNPLLTKIYFDLLI